MLIKFEVKIELPIIRLGSLFERLEQVLDAVRGERRLTKDTHDLKDGPANLEVVLDDGNEEEVPGPSAPQCEMIMCKGFEVQDIQTARKPLVSFRAVFLMCHSFSSFFKTNGRICPCVRKN